MNSNKHIPLMILILAASSSAFSEDAMRWDGLYAGIHAGYGQGKSVVSTSINPDGFDPPEDAALIGQASKGNINSGNFTGGLAIGYKHQFSKWLMGGEIDWSSINAENSFTGTGAYCCVEAIFANKIHVRADKLTTVRGILGYPFGRSLAYLTGGLAMTKLKVDQQFTDGPGTTIETFYDANSFSKTKYGWTLGLGYEYALHKDWSFKVEYLYARFNVASSPSENGNYPQSNSKADLAMNIARIGINRRW